MIDLIPVGSENAILVKDLAGLTNTNERAVKAKIRSLRMEGLLILSQASGGYFFPSSGKKGMEEAERYIKMMRRQISERLETIEAASQWLALQQKQQKAKNH